MILWNYGRRRCNEKHGHLRSGHGVVRAEGARSAATGYAVVIKALYEPAENMGGGNVSKPARTDSIRWIPERGFDECGHLAAGHRGIGTEITAPTAARYSVRGKFFDESAEARSQ